MRLTRATNSAVRFACLNFHYAKAVPVNTIGYNVYNAQNEWCGVVLYGAGANYNIGNQYDLPLGCIVELVRVALNGKQECTSQAVAMSLKRLHKDCPLVRLVVSYADCDQSHLGTIYQATNWIYTGTQSKDCSWIINGKRYHRRTIGGWVKNMGGLKGLTCKQFLQRYYDPNAQKFVTKGKRKYLYPLDKHMRKQIEHLRKPYPKADDNWQKIDCNTFKNEVRDNI